MIAPRIAPAVKLMLYVARESHCAGEVSRRATQEIAQCLPASVRREARTLSAMRVPPSQSQKSMPAGERSFRGTPVHTRSECP